MPKMRNMNEEIGSREIVTAINRLKAGKAVGMDDIGGECIRKGRVAIVEWLARVFKGCFVLGCVLRTFMDLEKLYEVLYV